MGPNYNMCQMSHEIDSTHHSDLKLRPVPVLLFRFTESKSRNFPYIMQAVQKGELTEEQAEYRG